MSTDSADLQILQELRKIRKSLVEDPAPPTPSPAPTKGILNEFTQFLNKHGVVGLAFAFIIRGAVKDLVSAPSRVHSIVTAKLIFINTH